MTHAHAESHKRRDKPTTVEALTRYNGDLVEALFASEPWTEIVFPLIQEMIAGVSGRFTNGRFHKGSLTKRGTVQIPLESLSGYQMALEEFVNNLDDFVRARDKMIEDKKSERLEKKAPVYNPFLEELHAEEKRD